jgi:hypothetical protein
MSGAACPRKAQLTTSRTSRSLINARAIGAFNAKKTSRKAIIHDFLLPHHDFEAVYFACNLMPTIALPPLDPPAFEAPAPPARDHQLRLPAPSTPMRWTCGHARQLKQGACTQCVPVVTKAIRFSIRGRFVESLRRFKKRCFPKRATVV